MKVVKKERKEKNRRKNQEMRAILGEAAQGNEHQEVVPGLARLSYIN